MSSQYGELRPTSGWDRFGSLGDPNKFQRLSHLGSITACHSGSGSQPNFAALNRGRHLYSAGRPSRWALAHILVCLFFCLFVYASNISGTAEWICAKFTRKTCLAPCSDEFECQGQRSRSPGTKTGKLLCHPQLTMHCKACTICHTLQSSRRNHSIAARGHDGVMAVHACGVIC